jgi:hypothetical protein
VTQSYEAKEPLEGGSMPVGLPNPLLESRRMRYNLGMPCLALMSAFLVGCAVDDSLAEPQPIALSARSTSGISSPDSPNGIRIVSLGDTARISQSAALRNMNVRFASRSSRRFSRVTISDSSVLRPLGHDSVVAIAPGIAQVVSWGAIGRSVETFQVVARDASSQTSASLAIIADLRIRVIPGANPQGELSSGVPLAPGQLRKLDLENLAVFVGDRPIPANVEPLRGLHADGSLRSILVQFSVTDAAAPVSLRRVAIAPQRRTRIAPNPVPERFLMYDDLHAEARTLVVGPVSLSADETSQGGRALDAKFSEFEPIHWAQSGDTWTANFYDRALAYFTYSIRQGSTTYFNRGARLAVAYRRNYLEPNNYGTSEWWAQLDGLAAHYWLTGDDSSRTAVIRAAESLNLSRGGTARLTNTTSHEWMDGRVTARVLSSKFLAIALDAEPYGTVAEWRSAALKDLTDVLSVQAPDGAWRYYSNCNESSNFMSGLIAGALIQYADVTGDAARVREPVRRFANWLWSTQWRPTDEVFNYYSGKCSKDGVVIGDAFAGSDLNGFFLEMYGWLWKQTGDATHVRRGDAVLSGMVSRSWFAGSKQFNEVFRTSPRYLALRGN